MIGLELNREQNEVKEMLHNMVETVFRPYAREADRLHEPPKGFYEKIAPYAEMFASGTGEGEGEAMKSALKGSKDQQVDSPDNSKPTEKSRLGVIAAEELGWGDPALGLQIPGPNLGGPPVVSTGTPEQKKRFLGVFKPDEVKYGAYALTEPGAGSDVSNISTTAAKDGNYYILNGTKCFCTNGAKAEWRVVFATVDKSLGRAGHRAFVVTKDNPGCRVGKIEQKCGLRASETAELVFEDCKVHKDDLLGGEEYYEQKAAGGFGTAMATFDYTRPMVAAMATGVARASYEIALEWAKKRYDFRRPLPRYRALIDKLADMKRRIDLVRLMAWNAAWMADMGMPNAREASMSKAYAGTECTKICSEAIEIMGMDGLSEDYLVEKFFRDIKVYDIFEGTGQINRIIIAKRIIEGLKEF